MIVVTVGAGFIGSAIVNKLNERGRSDILIVDELDRLTLDKKQNVKFLNFTKLYDKEEFLIGLKNGSIPHLEFIFHLGACSSTTSRDREYIFAVNYEYTKKLALLSVEKNIPLVYASSAATYGDGKKGFSDSHDKLNNYEPLNIYGQSKHLFDIWAEENGLLDKIVGLKYFNVYGPNEYHKGDMRSFVIKAYEQINRTGRVRLFKSLNNEYADGEQKRDFLYIVDAVDMTLYFYDNVHIKGIYNIGMGIPRTWNELVNAVFKAAGREVNIQYIDMPDSVKDQYQYWTSADMEKFKQTGYDFLPVSLEDGVSDYVKNYLAFGNRRLGEKIQ